MSNETQGRLETNRLTPRLRDLAANCDLRQAANACMATANAVQRFGNPGVRLIGLATAFLIAAEAAGISVTDMMVYARNCMNTAEGRRVEFKATTDYIVKEIIND